MDMPCLMFFSESKVVTKPVLDDAFPGYTVEDHLVDIRYRPRGDSKGIMGQYWRSSFWVMMQLKINFFIARIQL